MDRKREGMMGKRLRSYFGDIKVYFHSFGFVYLSLFLAVAFRFVALGADDNQMARNFASVFKFDT